MKLETIKLSELNPAEYNPRTITAEEFEGLKESLKTFGQQENLIVNKDMTIISGHQRFQAMKKLGWTEAVCNMVDLDKHAEKKLNVIMNSTAISGKYDDLKLSEILEELKLDDDYESLRLDKLEPLDLSDIEIEEDEAPEVSSEPAVSKLGEVYQLGRHRVMCGDSTDKTNVELLMDGVKADMVFTDPPYGAGFDIENDNENAIDVFSKFYSVMPCDDNIYICCDFRCIGDFYNEVRKKHQVYNLIVWVKNLFGQGKLYHTKHEEIIFCGEGSFNNKNSNNDENVWNADSVRNFGGSKNAVEAVGHPTQKPIEICARAINNSSNKSNIVYDGFLGSGSTLIACEQTDRICFGMELDPKYVDVIRKRYWKFVNGNEEGWQDGTTN